MAKNQPIGYVIHPQGLIESQKLEIDQSVFWGKEDSKKSRPAWLIPTRMHRTTRFPFVFLGTDSLAPIPFPGEDRVKTNRERLSQVMEAAYQRIVSTYNPTDATTLKLLIMIVAMTLTLGLVALAVSVGAIQYFSDKAQDVVGVGPNAIHRNYDSNRGENS